jgi:hypothetical protein
MYEGISITTGCILFLLAIIPIATFIMDGIQAPLSSAAKRYLLVFSIILVVFTFSTCSADWNSDDFVRKVRVINEN